MAKKYMTIYEKLRHDITSGAYAYGDKLPSKRALADATHTSVVTVEHAYTILCDEGYIEARPKSGYYVLYQPAYSYAVPDEAPLSREAPPRGGAGGTFPFSVLAKKVRWVLAEYGERTLEKTDSAGLPLLRQAICAYLARSRGIAVTPRQVVIGSGAEYLYGLVAKLFADKVFGTETPAYAQIERIYASCGVRCERLKLGRHGILSEELQRTAAQVLHITPYRSYPTGVTASASKRQEYLEWVSRPDRFIVEDDYESEFSVLTKVEDTLFARDTSHSVLYINTFSMTISPALRMAYMVLPMRLVDAFDRELGFFSCPVSTPEQYLAAELLRSGDFERHINRVRRQKRRQATDNAQKIIKK